VAFCILRLDHYFFEGGSGQFSHLQVVHDLLVGNSLCKNSFQVKHRISTVESTFFPYGSPCMVCFLAVFVMQGLTYPSPSQKIMVPLKDSLMGLK